MAHQHICICTYPLLIIDNREGKGIEYIAMPIEVVKDGDMPVPTIDYESAVGFDGVERDYIKVQWQENKKGDIITKHDVAGHIVSAGCDVEGSLMGKDGAYCEQKDIYIVLHPAEEWVEKHVIELGQELNKMKGG